MNSGVLKAARIELARRSFWHYARLRAPDFYRDSRKYLKDICDTIQAFLASQDDVLIVNGPPRHGKSRTAQLAVEWVLGKNNQTKVMTGSYNEGLAVSFSKGVRDAIQEVKAEEERVVYSDIFPKTKIKVGDAAMKLWSLQGAHTSYLATSPSGTATGFGANVLILDDLIKNAREAQTAHVLAGHWDWFTKTMLSRLEEGGKLIVIMTRWHSKDLSGRIIEELPSLGYKVKVVTHKALQDDGTMLCSEILSRESYERKVKAMGRDIAEANYQQAPIDLVGRLYSGFKVYTETPTEAGASLFEEVRIYADTADTGSDFLCSIAYGVYQGAAYVLDVIHTTAPMEITERQVANQFKANRVDIADVESNAGGRGFARSVERILRQEFGHKGGTVTAFTQTKNKVARILSNSTFAMNNIFMPSDWATRWPSFYDALYDYQAKGKNAHDDAADALTGVAEVLQNRNSFGRTDAAETIKRLKRMGL